MELIDILKKQGGITLFKRYWESGVFFTAVVEFLLLGKSKTALEILRLSTQLKVKQKLKRKYKKKLEEFSEFYNKNLVHEMSNNVWVCWLQGIENAPLIVQKCYESLQKNLKNKKIILITEDNYKNYIQFPEFIQKKIDLKIITKTHMSDMLRLELLTKYGGTWIDATVLCTSNRIPNYMFESDLFLFQCLKPGRDGHAIFPSSWFITASSNNKLLLLTRDLLYLYWEKNNKLIDYFLFHIFLQIVLESYPEEWQKVVPFDNSVPHILQLRLFENYNDDIWKALCQMTPFHKLTYKFDFQKTTDKNTYYNILFTN